MYLDFYQLKRAPFERTPDPALLFRSASHQGAVDTIAAGIGARQSLVVITGAPGVGKTMLVHAYLARVAPLQRTTIVLWQARRSFRELLILMARRLVVPVVTDDPEVLLPQIQQCLRHESQQGRQVVLLIDEAQDLPLETLAQFPVLATVPPSTAPLLQIVLVGEPALLQHLRRRGRHRVAPRIGSHATLEPLTEAESLAYIRQRIARVALPGGPLFTPEALTVLVRYAHGMPRDLNRLCTAVLRAGYRAQQQPITADLVLRVLATSWGAPPRRRGRRSFVAAAGLLAAGLLGIALFNVLLQGGRPATRAHSWIEEARWPTHVPRVGTPPPPPSAAAPPARAVSIPDVAVGHNLDAGHVRLAPWESLERQHLETSPITLSPPAPAVSPPLPTSTALATPPPPATLMGRGLKACDELKAEIQAKLDAKNLTDYTLTIMGSEEAQGHQIVGSCAGSTKKIALNRSQNAP
jgi:type II secretory pathway predicted ATPase ExeA